MAPEQAKKDLQFFGLPKPTAPCRLLSRHRRDHRAASRGFGLTITNTPREAESVLFLPEPIMLQVKVSGSLQGLNLSC